MAVPLCLSLLCPSQLITPSSLHCPCPGVEPLCRARGLTWALNVYEVQAVAVQLPLEMRTDSEALPTQASETAVPTMLRCHPKSKSPLCPMAKLSPQSWQPCSSEELQGEVSGAGVFAWLRLGHAPGNGAVLNPPSLPCLRNKSRELVRSLQTESRLPTDSPTSQGGSSFLCQIPGLGHPICGLNHSLLRKDFLPCNLPFPLSPIPGGLQFLQWEKEIPR